MARLTRTGNRVLPHERLVDVQWGKLKIRGVAFGNSPPDHLLVCIARDELAKHGMTGHGPCINKRFHTKDVTSADGEAILVNPEVKEYDDEDLEIEVEE